MGITVYADIASDIDYAAIRADGYEAEITSEQCGAIARLVDGIEGQIAYPAANKVEEEFYGSYVPGLPIALLSEEAQAQIRQILAGNEAALALVDKTVTHRIRATFTRDCGDRKYRVRLVSEPADNVDVSMSGGNWKEFRDAIGIDGSNKSADHDSGELTVTELEQALDESATALMFSGRWHQEVTRRLRALIAYAKAKGATQVAWA